MTATHTMMSGRAAELRAVLAELRTMGDSPRVRLALAEGEFRLAIAPDTTADEGIELLRSAVSHDPYLVKGYLHLGRLLHRRGRYRAAVPEYLAALNLAPASRRSHLLLAEALLELGKDEQRAGEDLIAALAERRPEQLRAVVAGIDDLLTADGAADSADDAERGEKNEKKKGAAARRHAAKTPADLAEIWPVWLLAHLSRPGRRAQVAAGLKAAAAQIDSTGPADFAIGCLLVLLSGNPPGEVRNVITAADVELAGADEPIGKALAAALELAEATDAETFVRAAATHLTVGVLPAVVVCWLHFTRFGPSDDRSVTEALQLVDAYPAAFQADGWLQELRIALLDEYARRSWSDGSLAQARLLWRETIAFDPYRVPVAVNLALLAARMNAAEEYEPAWERLFELMYLLAAGVGDVQLMLAERRDLHLALTRQSWKRHCVSTPPTNVPQAEELGAWVADADALTVWLRDWDGYYVNARLSFRSPIHILGVSRDVSTAALAEARDALVGHIDAAFAGRGWAGSGVFRELAVAVVEDAYAQAAEPVDRARDQYYETEKVRADGLADEMVQRTLVLLALVGALARVPAGEVRAGQAAAVVRHQLSLPRTTLQSLFVAKGLLEHDLDLVEFFEEAVVRLAESWVRSQPTTNPDWTRVAARLDELVEVLPQRLALRVLQGQALYAAKRPQDAYAAAVAALAQPVTTADDQTADLRGALVELIDQIGYDDVPTALRRPTDVITAEQTIGSLNESLERYPASTALRALLAELYLSLDRSLGGGTRHRHAAGLLVTGIIRVLDDRQSPPLEELLATVPRMHAAAAVRAASAELRNTVVARLPTAMDQARTAAGIGQVTRCLALARRYALSTEVTALDQVLSQLRQVEQQHRRAGEE
ncbi:MAG: hypothetical protein H0U62_11115 [Actinobacteria bacterium]|nr:hypothetical protein [Actinomycetota bacterium]